MILEKVTYGTDNPVRAKVNMANAVRLTNLKGIAFQHVEDRLLLDKLRSVPMLPKLVAGLVDQQKLSIEIDLVANGERVSP